MSTQDTKFEAFWTALENDCPYELPQEIKPFLQNALKAAGFYETHTLSVNNGGEAVTKTRKLSGYNIFMKEKMAELKAQNVPGGERMGKVISMWKSMSIEEKDEWKVKAQGSSCQTGGKVTQAKTQKLSGYHLFMKEKMVELKADSSIPASGRMAEIGKMWKALSEKERDEWKTKAKSTAEKS